VIRHSRRPGRAALAAAFLLTFVASSGMADEALDVTSSFSAADKLADFEELKSLAADSLVAYYDTSKAAKVENFVIERDTAKITLTGYVFLREPVRGLISSAHFFGEGRFELGVPLEIERQQVQRFLGQENIDQKFTRTNITFTGLEDQLAFQALEYTAENAREAAEEHEAAKSWVEGVEKAKERKLSSEDVARRRFGAHYTALNLYERLLYVGQEGTLSASFWVDIAEDVDRTRSHVDRINYAYNPDEAEEVRVSARFNHGKRKPTSLVAEFARSDMYKGRFKYAATSPALEKRNTFVAVPRSFRIKMDFDPGAKQDVAMEASIDVEFVRDGQKILYIYVSPVLGTKAAWLDGEEVDFLQPKIPFSDGYARVIWIPLPRKYDAGERVQIKLQLEGIILAAYDGATWMVRDTDNWMPSPIPPFSPSSWTLETTMIVPHKFEALAPGEHLDCRPEDEVEGKDCFRFLTSRPVAAATFGLGKGIRVDQGEAVDDDATPVMSYTNPGTKVEFSYFDYEGQHKLARSYNLSKTSPAMVNKVRACLPVYEEWCGPYPYKKMALFPNPSGVGRGFPSLLLLWQNAYLSKVDQVEIMSRATPYWVDAFVAHETAHQWWGHVAGIRSSRDQWFSEGFADYASLVYLEAHDKYVGTDWKQSQLEEWHEALTVNDGAMHEFVPLSLGNRVVSAENPPPFDRGSLRQTFIYNKGGYVMHMLRTLARQRTGSDRDGDELFRNVIRAFLDSCYGGFPSNLDMEKSISLGYGENMAWFFKQWVHGMGLPKIQFSHEWTKHPDGGWLLRGRVKQQDTAFKFPVGIFLHEGKGKNATEQHFYQWITQADETFEVGPLPKRFDRVSFNDDYGLLCIWEQTDWQGAAGQ
jgi:hypothetical protein